MRKQKGFSLIELLIVVAIILIIAAIAVPSLLRSRMLANESAAASTIRTLNTAEATYQSTFPATGYSLTLPALGPGGTCPGAPTIANACLIDLQLASAGAAPGKSGYLFQETGIPTGGVNLDFVNSAGPAVPTTTGNRTFCATSDMVVRVAGPPAVAPPVTVAACQAFLGLNN